MSPRSPVRLFTTSKIAAAAAGLLLAGWGANGLAAQDKYTLKVPDGLALSEFRGYEAWAPVAVSQTEESLKVISANPQMIKAYQSGLPAAGKTFPDGSKVVKIEWARKDSKGAPYSVMVPGDLKSVAVILKDTKRFPKTKGWAYAIFKTDASGALKPDGKGAECGFACHSKVAAQDYIFTAYPKR
jgi:hypothetical protein